MFFPIGKLHTFVCIWFFTINVFRYCLKRQKRIKKWLSSGDLVMHFILVLLFKNDVSPVGFVIILHRSTKHDIICVVLLPFLFDLCSVQSSNSWGNIQSKWENSKPSNENSKHSSEKWEHDLFDEDQQGPRTPFKDQVTLSMKQKRSMHIHIKQQQMLT